MLSKHNVWYCWQKLTAKAIRKVCMTVIYETSTSGDPIKKLEKIERKYHIIHTRKATLAEVEDFKDPCYNRIFFMYNLFLRSKNYGGDLGVLLENNFYADEGNVSLKERQLIRDKARALFYKIGYNQNEQFVKDTHDMSLREFFLLSNQKEKYKNYEQYLDVQLQDSVDISSKRKCID